MARTFRILPIPIINIWRLASNDEYEDNETLSAESQDPVVKTLSESLESINNHDNPSNKSSKGRGLKRVKVTTLERKTPVKSDSKTSKEPEGRDERE